MLQQLTKSKDSLKKPLFVADTRWLNGFGTGTGCRVGGGHGRRFAPRQSPSEFINALINKCYFQFIFAVSSQNKNTVLWYTKF